MVTTTVTVMKKSKVLALTLPLVEDIYGDDDSDSDEEE